MIPWCVDYDHSERIGDLQRQKTEHIKRLQEEEMERLRGKSPSGVPVRPASAGAVVQHARSVSERRRRAEQEILEREVAECTFKPKVS